MAIQGVIPSPEAWKKLGGTVRHSERHKPTRKARQQKPSQSAPTGMRYAKLTASLSAASAFLDGATTATAVFVDADPANAGDLVASTTEITITNRWVDLALASGKYVIVARIAGEWVIVASECP